MCSVLIDLLLSSPLVNCQIGFTRVLLPVYLKAATLPVHGQVVCKSCVLCLPSVAVLGFSLNLDLAVLN